MFESKIGRRIESATAAVATLVVFPVAVFLAVRGPSQNGSSSTGPERETPRDVRPDASSSNNLGELSAPPRDSQFSHSEEEIKSADQRIMTAVLVHLLNKSLDNSQ